MKIFLSNSNITFSNWHYYSANWVELHIYSILHKQLIIIVWNHKFLKINVITIIEKSKLIKQYWVKLNNNWVGVQYLEISIRVFFFFFCIYKPIFWGYRPIWTILGRFDRFSVVNQRIWIEFDDTPPKIDQNGPKLPNMALEAYFGKKIASKRLKICQMPFWAILGHFDRFSVGDHRIWSKFDDLPPKIDQNGSKSPKMGFSLFWLY